jgi:hypothetical protein
MSGVSSDIPKILLTDRAGPSQRLRVDSGQTGFFAGREARTFKELNLAALGVYTLQFVSPVNFIVQIIEISIETGILKYESFSGATPAGSYSETLPILKTNSMTEVPAVYTPQMVITAGGTVSGGTNLDISRVRANAITVQATTVGSIEDNVRGYPPGTYYVRLTNISAMDPVVGTIKFRWEERVP